MNTLLPFEKEKELRESIMKAYMSNCTYPFPPIEVNWDEVMKSVKLSFPDVTQEQFDAVRADVVFYISEKKVW